VAVGLFRDAWKPFAVDAVGLDVVEPVAVGLFRDAWKGAVAPSMSSVPRKG
jgi:hypothetical protein